MTWSETLYEEEDLIKYCQYSYGPIVEKSGFEDIEYICEIAKDQKIIPSFSQLALYLNNIEPKGDMEKFEKYLKSKNIKFKTHIWQKHLLD